MVKALVSAAAASAAVRGHVDRVHDLARRLGCTVPEAAAATDEAVRRLLDDLDRRPGTVRDLVGGLYARVWRPALGNRHSIQPGVPAAADRAGVIGDDERTAQVTRALGALSDRARFALLVRDSYALDPDQTAVATALDPPEAARVVALARLAFAAALDQTSPVNLAGHDVAVGDLGQLVDSSAPPGGRFGTLRRHVSGCALCASALAAQSRARDALAAFPVLGMDDEARGALLRETEQRAAILLPTSEEVRRSLEEGSSRRPLVPPSVVIGVLVIAALVGVGVGALLRDGGSAAASETLAATAAPSSAGSSAATVPATGPSSASPPRSASAASPTSSTTASTPASSTHPSTPPTSAPPVVPKATARPTQGPLNTKVTITATGLPASILVHVDYVATSGATRGSTVQATTDARGRLSVTATADDGTPVLSYNGPHWFEIRDAKNTLLVRVGFTQTPPSSPSPPPPTTPRTS